MLSSASTSMLSFAKLTLGGPVASSVGSRFQRGFFSAHSVASSSTHGSCSTGALVRAFSSSGGGGVLVPASLPDLPYDYSALEPAISADIMKLHHSKHHQTYVTNFNATMEKVLDAQAKGDTAAAIALQGAVKFNGGGHVNHSIFWQNLCPVKDFTPPEGALLSAINDEFGSLDAFQTKFAATAAGVQGSGWGWLGYDKATGRLAITTTANQDPCVTTGLVPLLGVDVWEHAYYLQYKNVRPDYLKAVWDVINWKDVATKLEHAKA